MIAADLFGDNAKLELFLAVAGSEKLEGIRADEEMSVVAVLAVNVEFCNGVMAEDNVMLMICDMFLDNPVVELFTVKVGVILKEVKIEVSKKVVAWLLKLATLDDGITVLLND